LKVTEPGCETLAVIVIARPIGVVVIPPSNSRDTEGLRRAIEIVNELVVEVAPLLSVTVTVIDEFPAAVAVPEIVPEELLRDKPAGSKPLAREKLFPPEPPVAEMVKEKDELKVPDSPEFGVVITSVGETVKERVTVVADS
jgi:hypothetical protein